MTSGADIIAGVAVVGTLARVGPVDAVDELEGFGPTLLTRAGRPAGTAPLAAEGRLIARLAGGLAAAINATGVPCPVTHPVRVSLDEIDDLVAGAGEDRWQIAGTAAIAGGDRITTHGSLHIASTRDPGRVVADWHIEALDDVIVVDAIVAAHNLLIELRSDR